MQSESHRFQDSRIQENLGEPCHALQDLFGLVVSGNSLTVGRLATGRSAFEEGPRKPMPKEDASQALPLPSATSALPQLLLPLPMLWPRNHLHEQGLLQSC